MPIRRLTIHACAYGVMLACSTHVQADGSPWNGSYAAQGGCYCVGEQSRYIDSRIMPTPVGGQSVGQICERVGDGPKLQKFNGKFNFTVYADAQCGNGPFSDLTIAQDNGCIGHRGVRGEDCELSGPRWDLTYAYSRKAIKTGDSAKESIVTGVSRYIKPPIRRVVKADGKKPPASDSTVVEIVRTRVNSKKRTRRTPKVTVPETREQIRARQLVHLAAARKRAELARLTQANTASATTVESLPTDATTSLNVEELKPANPKVSGKASVESAADEAMKPAVPNNAPTTVTALKLPAELSYSEPDFNYIEAAPVNYDFGGAGMSVAASKSSHRRMQYLLKAAAAETFQEAAVGVGMFLTPRDADRMTLIVRAGLEYGSLNFQNSAVKATHSDSGVFAAIATRLAFTRQFELQAGVSYSSFFEGDLIGFGAAFYHLTPKLDLTAKTEIGDNDLFGFGIRYHY